MMAGASSSRGARVRSHAMRRLAILGLALLFGFAPPPAKGPAHGPPAATPNETATKPTKPASVLTRVAFIGASATAGFGVVAKDPEEKLPLVPVPLAASFEGVVAKPIATYDLGSSFFFMDPGGTGRKEVDKALGHDATLVVATDFLFWYVYGADDGRGGPLRSEAARLDKLELGLAELDRFPAGTPIIVGDIPDMHRAVGKMISSTQMPKAETLAKANERIRAWAKGREQVLVFPLAATVDDLNAGKTIEVGGQRFEPGKGRLIQSDELHPTFRGSVAVAFAIAQDLKAACGERFDASLAKDESTAVEAARKAARGILDARAKPEQAEPARAGG